MRIAALLVFLAGFAVSCTSGGGGVSAIDVSVSPSSASVVTGGSRSFTATVTGSTDTSVTWLSTCGTVDASGNDVVYTAPNVATSCSVTATSVTDGRQSASAAVTILAPPVVAAPIAPGEATAACGAGVTCVVASTVEPTHVTIAVGGTTFTLSPRNVSGGAVNVGSDGSIVIPAGDLLALDLEGLDAATPVNVWLIRSDAPITLLQSVQPNLDGTVAFGVAPVGLMAVVAIANASGSSLLISAANTDGDTIDLQVGVVLSESSVDPSIVSVTIVGEPLRSLEVGATTQLEAVVDVAGGAATTLTWSSSEVSVTSVGETGLVTAIAAGTTVITAASSVDPDKSARVTIDVRRVPVDGVVVTPPAASIAVGATTQLLASPRDADGVELPDRSVAWSSSDAEVVTVSDAGLVTGVEPGVATVTASSEGASGSATITVEPAPEESPSMLVVAQATAGAASGAPFTTQPIIEIRDAQGNLATSATTPITSAITAGENDALTGTTTANAVAGIATFTNLTLTGTTGANTLTFTAEGLTSASSDAVSVTAGAASQMAIAEGDAQSAIAGAAVATAPCVIVRDASGNPVAGVAVLFAVASGDGAVDPTTAVSSGADGIAAVTSWTLGTVGVNTLTATSAGLMGSPLTFTATASPAPLAAPTITGAAAGYRQAEIAFTAPEGDGEATIANFAYSIDDGETWTVPNPAHTTSPLLITGLTISASRARSRGSRTGALSCTPTSKPTCKATSASMSRRSPSRSGMRRRERIAHTRR